MGNTYAVFGLCARLCHQQQPGALVVSLLAGQMERRELGLRLVCIGLRSDWIGLDWIGFG